MKPKYKHLAVITASTIGLTALASATNHGGEKYTYDGSGNIIEKAINGQITKMSYDASNKVISIDSATKGGESISYDAAGRPVSYKDAAGQAIRQLSYGYADKVLKADNAGSEAEFFYNAEGQLVGKTVGGKLTPYTWDGNVLAAEGANAFTNEAHITGGVPAMAGDQTVVISDYLGNTLSQGDQQFKSTAYGEGVEQGRFTGKAFIKELHSFLFQHRLYSPATNNWATLDPSGYPDGINSTTYVKGSPLVGVDPFGLKTLVKTTPVTLPAPTNSTGSRQSTTTNSGKIEYWREITQTATGQTMFGPFPAASGSAGGSVSVGCGLEGSSSGSWSVSAAHGPVSIGYTFGTSGTSTSSGSVGSPALTNSANSFEGDGGLVRMKISFVVWEEAFAKISDKNYASISPPQQTGISGIQPSSWLSGAVVGVFREYEY